MSKIFVPLEHIRGYEPVKSGSGEKLVGQAVRRTEDARLLCGMGTVSYTHLTLPTNREV